MNVLRYESNKVAKKLTEYIIDIATRIRDCCCSV